MCSDLEAKLVRENMELEEQIKILKKYIVRGGFIKDRKGRLCKEGDTVKCWQKGHKDKADTGVLAFDDKYTQTLNLLVGEDDWYMLFGDEKRQKFELVKACEPDVCKNF